MLDKILKNLRLLIIGFGFGAILSGTIYAWGVMPLSFKVFFSVALFIVFYFAIRFTFLPHKEDSYNKQHDTNSQRY